MRLALLALFSAAALASGCGAAAHTLGPTAAFVAEPAAGDTGALTPTNALVVPARAHLVLQPLWFTGRLATGGEYEPFANGPHLQVVVRVRHVDHSVTTWNVTGRRGDFAQAMPVDRRRPDARYHVPLGELRIGPVPAKDIEALEVLVSTVDPLEQAPIARGGAVLSDVPPLRAPSRHLEVALDGVRSAGGDLELAARLPVRVDRDMPLVDGAHQWLILVEAEPTPSAGPTAEDDRRLDAAARLHPAGHDGALAVADDAGRALPGLTAMAFAVRVVQSQVEPRPGEPRGTPPKEQDERQRRVPPKQVVDAAP